MKKKIVLSETEIFYDLKRFRNSKNVHLFLSCERGLLVTAPKHVSLFAIESILRKKEIWIIETLGICSLQIKNIFVGDRRERYIKHKEKTRALVEERLGYWNQYYKESWKSISIRDQRTRWGSCSKNKNLNFSYKLVFLPAHLSDYIIVHELCHLREMNHSPRFWLLVKQTMPNYKWLRGELKKWRLL